MATSRLRSSGPRARARQRRRRVGELLRRARLADAGLADQHDQAAAAAVGVAQLLRELRDLGGAADERCATRGSAAGSSRSYSDFGRGDGRGDALQLERAEVAEREGLAAGEQGDTRALQTDLAGAGASRRGGGR